MSFFTAGLLVSLSHICLSCLSICLPTWKETCLKYKCLYYWWINSWVEVEKRPGGCHGFSFQNSIWIVSLMFYDILWQLHLSKGQPHIKIVARELCSGTRNADPCDLKYVNPKTEFQEGSSPAVFSALFLRMFVSKIVSLDKFWHFGIWMR